MNSKNPTNDLILAYAKERGFRPRTVERWLALAEADRQAFLHLARELKMGENHLKDFLDWLEEIALRDGASFTAVLSQERLARILSDPRLDRNEKLKRAKEELRRLRFPRLAGIEAKIQNHIRELKLGPEILLTVPPGLESGAVTIVLKATGCDELKRLVGRVAEALARDEMKEIFSLLQGRETG